MFSVSYGLNDKKFVFFFKISSYHSNICRVLYQAKTNSCCSCYCWHNLCNRKVCTWRERLQITWWNLQLYGVYTCAQLLNCAWLFDPMDWSLPGLSTHGIFQARILEQVAISSSRESSLPRNWTMFLASSALQVDSLSVEQLLCVRLLSHTIMCSFILSEVQISF